TAGHVIDGNATDYEKTILAGETQVKMLNDLEQMGLPLYFEQLIGDSDSIRYSQPEDKSIVSLRSIGGGGADHATTISNQEMRVGRHFVTFHIAEEGRSIFESPIYVELGVIRPIKDWDKKGPYYRFDPICHATNQHKYRKLLLAEKTDEWGDDLHCCSYHSAQGKCYFANWNVEDKDEDNDWEVGR
ncbi:hypothetical protein THAOC_18667, partial [Thalassiosira oceanica]